MKNSKKLFIVIVCIALVMMTAISSFAENTNEYYLKYPPTDLGEIYDGTTNSTYAKFYIRIEPELIEEGTTTLNLSLFTWQGYDNSFVFNIYKQTLTPETQSYININANSTWGNTCSFVVIPNCFIKPINSTYYYIPIYIYNGAPIIDNLPDGVVFYKSSTLDITQIQAEAYSVGYSNGFKKGYTDGLVDGAEIVQDLNLVEHCEQLLGTFVGDDYAHYITPLCLALVVILIYFLFIRWLLALVKSKNVTRVADIIVCTACIIMLVIMYAPMLDLTIHQAQTVYQISADTIVGG